MELISNNYSILFILLILVIPLGIIAIKVAKGISARQDLERRLKQIKNLKGGSASEGSSSVKTVSGSAPLTEQTRALEEWLTDSVFGYAQNASEHYRLRFEQAGWSPKKAPIISLLITLGLIAVCVVLYSYFAFGSQFMSKKPFALKLVGFPLVIFVSARFFEYVMDFIIKQRYVRIQRVLTYCLDLLVVCSRAGFSLDRSFEKIAEEMSYYNRDISKEMIQVSIELTIIPDRQQALRKFARRVDIPMVNIMVSSLIHAEEQGASISQTLTTLSREFTKIKALEIEKKAARLPVLMTMPLALFFLPVILMIIIGPIIGNFMELGVFGK